jgi:kynureninase
MHSTAKQLDLDDSLSHLRSEFYLPEENGVEEVYFVGNSLGLMPRRVQSHLEIELDRWKSLGVRGHFSGETQWVAYHELLAPPMANIVGGLVDEVVMMNGLTVNLHLMLSTFFRPKKDRFKILMEYHAFPSDQYAVDSHVQWHGLQPDEAVIRLAPPDGQQLLSTDRIVETIEQNSNSLALVLLPGIQYYTGQVFDMAAITEAAHRFDIPVGFDLAHAAGNIELQLHDWDVDFAVWCTYKYLNSGPGSIAGCFVHRRHATNLELGRLAGWWGHDQATRFQMGGQFQPIPKADGWQLSNPPILSLAAIRASLEIFEQAGWMGPLRRKSVQMQQYFRECLTKTLGDQVQVIAPAEDSGCQSSLEINLGRIEGKRVYEQLEAKGVRTDWREPRVIRAAPVPLYNTFSEIAMFVAVLDDCLNG